MLQRTRNAQRILLEEYAKTGHIERSCQKAGVSSVSHRRWTNYYKGYKRRFERARQLAIEGRFEKACDDRAVDGIDEPVFQGGELVGYKRRYSDALLMFRLRALAPDKYREVGGTTNVAVNASVTTGSPGTKIIEMMEAINVAPEVKQVTNGHANGVATD
jgi:hypothetical protein